MRSGTLLVGGAVLPHQNGPLGNASSAILLGDSGTGGGDYVSLQTNGSFTIARPILVNAQNTAGLTIIGGASGQTTSSIDSGTITLNRQVYLTSSTTGANTIEFQGEITGSGGVTKAGPGAVLLTAANSYAGPTTVASGVLKLGSANAIPSGAGKGNLYVYGTLDLGGFDAQINGLGGDGRITNNRNTSGTNMLTVGVNGAGSVLDLSGPRPHRRPSNLATDTGCARAIRFSPGSGWVDQPARLVQPSKKAHSAMILVALCNILLLPELTEQREIL